MRKRVRRGLRTFAWFQMARILAHLPTKVSSTLLRPFTALAARMGPGAVATANLNLVLKGDSSPPELRQIKRDIFRHLARQTAESAHLAHSNPKRLGSWLEQHVELHPSISHLHKALEQGRGAIVVTAHLGHWELLAAALVHAGMHGAVVGRYRERDPSAKWVLSMRENYGVQTLPQDSSPRALLEVLKRGEVLGLLCDLKNKRLHGEDVLFFGRPARTMSAPASLARASEAPLVPVRCVRRGSSYVLMAEEPLAYDRSIDRHQAQSQLLTEINQTFERWIREDPEQWVWYRPRW